MWSPCACVKLTESPHTFEIRNQVPSQIFNVQRTDPSSMVPDKLIASITCEGGAEEFSVVEPGIIRWFHIELKATPGLEKFVSP